MRTLYYTIIDFSSILTNFVHKAYNLVWNVAQVEGFWTNKPTYELYVKINARPANREEIAIASAATKTVPTWSTPTAVDAES